MGLRAGHRKIFFAVIASLMVKLFLTIVSSTSKTVDRAEKTGSSQTPHLEQAAEGEDLENSNQDRLNEEVSTKRGEVDDIISAHWANMEHFNTSTQ